MEQVGSATLTNLTLQSNTASFAGGAAVILQAGQVSWSDSIISNNKASMGGALAVDSSGLTLLRVALNNNTAGDGEAAASLQQVGACFETMKLSATLLSLCASRFAACLQYAWITVLKIVCSRSKYGQKPVLISVKNDLLTLL